MATKVFIQKSAILFTVVLTFIIAFALSTFAADTVYAADKPLVSLSSITFSPSTPTQGQSFTTSVTLGNTGSTNCNVDYEIEFYSNGSWGNTKSGYKSGVVGKLTTPSYTVPSSATKIRVTWTIQSDNYNTRVNPYELSKEVSVNKSASTSSSSSTYSGSSSDYSDPNIDLDPNPGSTVSAGRSIKINATDSNGIHHIGYAWDSESADYDYDGTAYTNAPDDNGSHTLRVYAVDNSPNHNDTGWKSYTYYISGGSSSDGDDDDDTAPSISLSPSSGSTISSGQRVNITASDSGRGNSGIKIIGYAWDSSSAHYEYDDDTYTYAPSSSGTHYLRVYAIDNSSNYNDTGWKSYTYYIGTDNDNDDDRTAPSISLSPNQGSTISSGQRVNIYASDSGRGNSGIKIIGYAWDSNAASYQYSDSTYTFAPSSSGTHYLRVYAIDNSSNYNDTGWQSYSYTINSGSDSDTSAPYNGSISINSGNATTNNTSVSLTISASDNVGVTQMMVSNDSGFSSAGWESYSTYKSWSLTNGDGTKYVYIKFKDAAGNISSVYSDSIQLVTQTQDTQSPSGSIRINNNDSVTYTTNVTLNINATDNVGVTQMLISNDSGFSSTNWESYTTSRSWTLTSGEGTKYVYIKFKDAAGNISSTYSDSIQYTIQSQDTQAPTGSISINGGNATTDSTSVTLNISAYDNVGVTQMMISNDSNFSSTGWESYSSSRSWSLTSGDGYKYVYIKFKDAAGNISSTYSDSIQLNNNQNNDTQAPTGSININNGDYITYNTYVTLNISAYDNVGVTQMLISNDSGFSGASWESYSSSRSWTLTSGDGTKYVYIRFKDAAGNASSVYSDSIQLNNNQNGDTQIPTGSININNGNSTTSSTYVTLNISAYDNNGVTQMMICNDSGFYSSSWESYTSTRSWTLNSGDGTRYVYIKFKDSAGNVSNVYSDSIYLSNSSGDSSAPYVISTTPSSGSTNAPINTSITINFNESIQTGDNYGSISISGSGAGISYKYMGGSTLTINSITPNNNTQYTVYIPYGAVKDNNGNSNSSYSFSFTTTNSGSQIIYPGGGENGTINPNVNSLKVELRNSADRTKYSVDEEIIYYIDYFNGTRSQVEQAEVVMDIPYGFNVSNFYQGSQSGNTVVWSLGTLQPLQSGRLMIGMKCTSMSETEKTVTQKARIKRAGTVQDTTILPNLIFRTGNKSYHERYINGYPDGTFRPDRGITRAEFAAICARIFNLSSYYGSSNPYRDLKSKHWAYSSILACTEAGLFGGYPDGTFRPEKTITRAEFASVLARKIGIANTQPIWLHADDTRNHWAMNAMEQFYRIKMLVGYNDGTFKPDNSITRAEAVTLINRFMFKGALETSSSSTFRDVRSSHWAYREIEEAARNHSYTRTSTGDETIY